MKKPGLVGFLFLLIGCVFAQDADSLINSLSYNNDKDKVNQLMSQAKLYSNTNPNLSIYLVEEALTVAQNLNDPLLFSGVLNGVAIMNYLLGNNAKALEYSLKAIEVMEMVLQKHPDSLVVLERLESMLSNTSSFYGTLGDYGNSLQMLYKAFGIADTLMKIHPANTAYQLQHIRIQNNLATVNWSLGDTAEAQRILTHALHEAYKTEDHEIIGITLNNIGVIQIDKNQYPDALETYSEVLEICVKMNDSIGMSYSYNNLGLAMERMEKYPGALAYYQKANNISNRIGFSIGITSSSANMAKIYSQLSKPDSALYFVKMGIDEAERSNNKSYLLKSYETLYQIYEKMGKSDQALMAYKDFVQVKDSIFNLEKSKQITEMEARFENVKKEKENQILKQDIQLHLRNRWLLIIGLALVVVLSVMLYYYYYFKNKTLRQKTLLLEQKSQLNELEKSRIEDQLFAEQEINKLQTEKLQQQNRELSTRILHAINKNEAMNNILKEMEQLQLSDNKEVGECFGKVKRIVNDNISFDKEWDQFKLHFELVNPGFFYNLHQKCPTLTPSELKLCAYYRINLDTKEIARLLNVTNAAIQKGRHRLRKKMNIPSEIEISDFMSAF